MANNRMLNLAGRYAKNFGRTKVLLVTNPRRLNAGDIEVIFNNAF